MNRAKVPVVAVSNINILFKKIYKDSRACTRFLGVYITNLKYCFML